MNWFLFLLWNFIILLWFICYFFISVVDDDDSGVFTAGAIVTVTVLLERRSLGEFFDQDVYLESRAEETIVDSIPKETNTVSFLNFWFNGILQVKYR